MQNISIPRALSKKLCKTLHLSNLVETCVIDQMAEGNFVVEIINRDQLWQFDISWIALIFTHLHMSHIYSWFTQLWFTILFSIPPPAPTPYETVHDWHLQYYYLSWLREWCWSVWNRCHEYFIGSIQIQSQTHFSIRPGNSHFSWEFLGWKLRCLRIKEVVKTLACEEIGEMC